MTPPIPRFFLVGLLGLIVLHAWVWQPTEPHHNGDENRHVMTGVFVRDALWDAAWTDPIGYVQRYYLQYPALGLLAWPPLFYLVEGMAMSFFGTSFVVAQLCVAAFALMALVFVFLWVRVTTGHPRIAVASAILFGLTPLGFRYSRHVMLEMPTLAWCFAAMFFFERYLRETRRGDPMRVGLFAAFAALTRFDAVFLLLYFCIRLVATHRLHELRRPAVLLGILLALMLTAPYYFFTWKHYGSTLAQAVQQGTMPQSRSFVVWHNLPYYPSRIRWQVDWPIAVAAILGLFRSRQFPGFLGGSLALALSVYLTMTPLAELEDRHVIYWVPALATWASGAAESLPARWREIGYALLIVGTAISRTWDFPTTVHGYSEAAQKVLQQPRESHVVFFDGALSGNFIYQIRRHNTERSVMVLRGDKLVYGVRSDPAGGYVEWTRTPDDILSLLYRYDPDWVIIEAPQAIFPDLPGPRLLRQTLLDHPERYEHVSDMDVPLRGTHPEFQGVVLEFYRPRIRNPRRERLREVPMLSLGKPLHAPRD